MAINPVDITTIRVGQLAHALPTLTDNIAHEIGTDLFRCSIQELVNLFNINSNAFQYEIKTLNVNQTYIDTNFDSTGLGRLLCLGWAICNGNNGTVSEDGLVSVGYGIIYNVIGGYGGSPAHTLTIDEMPTHTHTYTASVRDNGDTGTFLETAATESNGTQSINPAGLGQPHNNMQPYIVQLKMMKL